MPATNFSASTNPTSPSCASIFRGFGLDGMALDLAIADCMRAAIAAIEQDRAAKARREEGVRLVQAAALRGYVPS